MLLIVTGFVVAGIRAIFSSPVIPGPLIKNANTSLNPELFGGAYSGYSSEAKT